MITLSLIISSLLAGQMALAEADEHPIGASQAIVVDADTGQVLFDRDADRAVPPASLTKIFTAVVALESASVDTPLTVDPYDLVGEASLGLAAGEELMLETLLYGLLLTSGNDAAMTIARSLGNLPGDSPQESVSRFIERINSTAERLGLEKTNLRNPHGLDQDGHVTSASDIAAMTMYALNNPVFREIISTPYYAGEGREMYNVNRMLDAYPGLIGGKTGITSRAGHSLMQVAQRDGKTVIVVLLGSTKEQWYEDARYLLDLGFDELASNPDDDSRAVVGLAETTAIDVPVVANGQSVGGSLRVDRVSDHEAVVRPSNPVSDDSSASWRWPLVSIGMMGVALVLVLNFPALVGLGTLAVMRGTQVRLAPSGLLSSAALGGMVSSISARMRRRHVAPRARMRRAASADSSQRDNFGSHDRRNPSSRSKPMSSTPFQTVSVSPARSRAERAIQLAMQSRYHAATDEFKRALELDPEIDLPSCPGFWRMQAMGYIAAAKAYMLNDQKDDARRLLTVVQLAFSNSRELSSLFSRAIRALDY